MGAGPKYGVNGAETEADPDADPKAFPTHPRLEHRQTIHVMK